MIAKLLGRAAGAALRAVLATESGRERLAVHMATRAARNGYRLRSHRRPYYLTGWKATDRITTDLQGG